jgi:ABC-type sulfate/molybdate transport systems ATPase subunit
MALLVNIKKKLPGFELDVSFKPDNGVLGILGPSGAGKSMTLRCIAGLDTPDSGQIILDKRVLYDSNKGINVSIKNRKIGILFQSYALFPHMTVEQNIGFGLDTLPQDVRKHKIKEKIAMMQLGGLEKRYPNQISGGQQQRVALARALAVEPVVLLLDEPLSALDDHLRELTANQLMDSLAQYSGVTLFVTHNIEEAYRICENLIVMSDGKVEAYGGKEEIFRRPPSLATAQITGCKNLSKARRIDHKLLEAADWGCVLNVDSIPHNVTHVGIRAHYITLSDDREQNNTYNSWPVFTRETLFEVTIYLSIGNPPSETQNYNMQWKVSKEDWYRLKEMPLPWRIHINSNKLFCF